MTKITLISKNQNGNRSYKTLAPDKFAENIRSGAYNDEPQTAVCFAAQWQRRSGHLRMKEYNALVLLEIDNLPERRVAEQVRNMAAQMPYTLLAYVAEGGRDVKIVCRIRPVDGEAADSAETRTRLHVNGFAKLHFIYSGHLQMTLENREPAMDSSCSVGADKDVFFNDKAETMIVSTLDEPLTRHIPATNKRKGGVPLLPGMDLHGSEAMAFESCLSQAYDSLHLKAYEPAQMTHALASALAESCRKCGLPKMSALHFCRFKRWYEENTLLVDTIFDNAYMEDELPFTPETAMRGNQLLAMKTENFINSHYELRKNVLTDVIQYRDRKTYHYDWQDITEEKLNEITFKALKGGVGAKDKDVKRFIQNTMVERFDPIEEWLFRLPKWDGTDRVAQLTDSIPTDDAAWKPFLHTWLLSMVAHWLGKDTSHGNALMPVLIGYQGCGKTTFCTSLLPREMRDYFSDKVNLKSDTTIQLALSRYALINIDEFDQIKKSQQPLLKFLISTADAKMRLPLASHIIERRRYASFIATTNTAQPLVDPTGSRRFVCIRVTGEIRSLADIDLPQLYAQLYSEINSGMRYWLDKEETALLEQHNRQFMCVEGLQDIICTFFRAPKPGETGKEYNIAEIMQIIKEKLPNFKANEVSARQIGAKLAIIGAPSKRKSSHFVYELVEK